MNSSAPRTSPADLPFATKDVPGIGGAIKSSPEDFVVEEIPAYAPSGSGEHLFLKIEKRGLTTLAAVDRVARAFSVSRGAIGYAGMKDARAVTRQWLSVHLQKGASTPAIDGPELRVLESSRHKNKLKLGHLRGNRFLIRVRDVVPGARDLATRAIAILAERGLPNGFGVQRFGARADTHRLGRALIANDAERFLETLLTGSKGGVDALELLRRGELQAAAEALERGSPESRLIAVIARAGAPITDALRFVDRPLRRLYFAATQAECFNEVLRRRFAEYDSVRLGDLAWLHRNGACFAVVDVAAERERARHLEISASGPLFGRRCSRPTDEPFAIEDAALADLGLDAESFSRCGEMDGARRPLRVPVRAEVEEADEATGTLRLAIELPPGAYATSVLRELMKRDGAAAELESEARSSRDAG